MVCLSGWSFLKFELTLWSYFFQSVCRASRYWHANLIIVRLTRVLPHTCFPASDKVLTGSHCRWVADAPQARRRSQVCLKGDNSIAGTKLANRLVLPLCHLQGIGRVSAGVLREAPVSCLIVK